MMKFWYNILKKLNLKDENCRLLFWYVLINCVKLFNNKIIKGKNILKKVYF